jgi:alpha-L-fucosidase
VGEQSFGLSKKQWTILNDNAGKLSLFDGKPNTSWISKKGEKEVRVDFGEEISFAGLTYLPDQARWSQGIALNYKIYSSNDGKTWNEVTAGNFSNIRNNPITQSIRFGKPVKTRFLKFATSAVADGQQVLGAAELDIITE